MKARWMFPLFLCAVFLFPALMAPVRAHAEDWLPIDPADLTMKDNPKHPGDHAMILWREVQADEDKGTEENYIRIKIFDTQGRDMANWETAPYNPEFSEVKNISARTVHPDGSVVPFTGNIMEKTVSKYRSSRRVAKVFTLPDVTAGSIIEYKYTIAVKLGWSFQAHWLVQDALFQRKAHFSVRPSQYAILRWSTSHLSPDHAPISTKDKKGGLVTLDIEDMRGYEDEPVMPPADEVIARVDFFHLLENETLDNFWKQVGKGTAESVNEFVDWHGAVKKELGQLLGPSDSNDVKLHKIYDRVQSLRNLSFVPDKDAKELKREKHKEKERENIEDVLHRGYGDHYDLNLLFLALVRGAGFEAMPVFASSRDRFFFDRNYLYAGQFDWVIVLVKDGGKERYFDPGTRFCPFGVIPWEFTSVMGLRLEKNSGTIAPIPGATPDKDTIVRKAAVQLQPDGSVKGEVEITFSGQQALDKRLDERDNDEPARKKNMEDLLRGWLPANGTVELKKVNSWGSSTEPLIVSYDVSFPGYAAMAGRRILLPTAFFARAWENPFTASSRTNNILFPYPYLRTDDVSITIPAEFRIDGLYDAKTKKSGLGEFSAQCKNENGVLHATRQFRLDRISLEAKYYPAVRSSFAQIAATQDEQAVLVQAAK